MPKWLLALVVCFSLCGVGFVAFQVGTFSGYKTSNLRRAEQSLNAIYRSAKIEISQAPESMDLCTQSCVDELRLAEKKYGKVESFKVTSVMSSPLSIPVMGVVSVQRANGSTTESWVMNSSRRFDGMSVEPVRP